MQKLKIALDVIPEKIRALLESHAGELEKAWLKKEERENLSVSFSAKFSIKQGENSCEVGISFVPEKICDQINFVWDEKQTKMALGK